MTSPTAPIKILHLVHSMGTGGMENGIVNVATRLDPEEFDVHVCCLSERGGFADRMPHSEQVVNLGKQSGFSLRWVTAVKKEIKRIQPDLLHTHNVGPLIYGKLACLLGEGVPVIHGEHAQLNVNEIHFKPLLVRRVFFRFCHKIHTVSQSLLDDFAQRGFATKEMQVIVNGVDEKRFRPSGDKRVARRRLDLPLKHGGILLGIVGRLADFKGHLVLLDAFDQMCNQGKDLRLLIVGGGGFLERAVIDRIASSPFTDKIHWAGIQKQPEKYMQAMDLMVSPSTNEGLSNVILESMACGIPVLANEACGNNEVIVHGDTGFLAQINTTNELVDAIGQTLRAMEDDPEIGGRARASVVRQFSMSAMVDGYRDLYLQVAGE